MTTDKISKQTHIKEKDTIKRIERIIDLTSKKDFLTKLYFLENNQKLADLNLSEETFFNVLNKRYSNHYKILTNFGNGYREKIDGDEIWKGSYFNIFKSFPQDSSRNTSYFFVFELYALLSSLMKAEITNPLFTIEKGLKNLSIKQLMKHELYLMNELEKNSHKQYGFFRATRSKSFVETRATYDISQKLIPFMELFLKTIQTSSTKIHIGKIIYLLTKDLHSSCFELLLQNSISEQDKKLAIFNYNDSFAINDNKLRSIDEQLVHQIVYENLVGYTNPTNISHSELSDFLTIEDLSEIMRITTSGLDIWRSKFWEELSNQDIREHLENYFKELHTNFFSTAKISQINELFPDLYVAKSFDSIIFSEMAAQFIEENESLIKNITLISSTNGKPQQYVEKLLINLDDFIVKRVTNDKTYQKTKEAVGSIVKIMESQTEKLEQLSFLLSKTNPTDKELDRLKELLISVNQHEIEKKTADLKHLMDRNTFLNNSTEQELFNEFHSTTHTPSNKENDISPQITSLLTFFMNNRH